MKTTKSFSLSFSRLYGSLHQGLDVLVQFLIAALQARLLIGSTLRNRVFTSLLTVWDQGLFGSSASGDQSWSHSVFRQTWPKWVFLMLICIQNHLVVCNCDLRFCNSPEWVQTNHKYFSKTKVRLTIFKANLSVDILYYSKLIYISCLCFLKNVDRHYMSCNNK